jgi:hypothetical protein
MAAGHYKEETLYSARQLESGRLQLAKWDGGKLPAETYYITNRGYGHCDCMGSSRNNYCKHKQIVDKWMATGVSFAGGFYDWERDIIYTPEDGEGIPLTGALEIPHD